MPKRINTDQAGQYAGRLEEFNSGKGVAFADSWQSGNRDPDDRTMPTLYARWREFEHDKVYVVYSYGDHFPLYIYSPGADAWFANSDKFSPTTTQHRYKAHPRKLVREEKYPFGERTYPVYEWADCEPHDTEWMKEVAEHGMVGRVSRILRDAIRQRRAA